MRRHRVTRVNSKLEHYIRGVGETKKNCGRLFLLDGFTALRYYPRLFAIICFTEKVDRQKEAGVYLVGGNLRNACGSKLREFLWMR